MQCLKICYFTLYRSKVWKGMKVLQPNSIILGTRKLWWIFPIKQKFDTRAAFLDNPKCSICTSLTIFLTVFSQASRLHNGQKTTPTFSSGFKHFTIKKAALVPNFCLIGKIHHTFLMSRMIELGCKTYMPIQTLDLDRVYFLKNIFWTKPWNSGHSVVVASSRRGRKQPWKL